MYGFTLIFVLTFIGGLIAYFGDKIGMKVGRRRLTIFGLRPKHTSILITVFTGIFITGASITILSIASEDVRTALFAMKEIQSTLATNQIQLEQGMQELNDARAELDKVNSEFAELEKRRATLAEEFTLASETFVKFATQIRYGNVALQAGEIVFAQTIQGGKELDEVTRELLNFLNQADEIAYQLGARVVDGSQSAIIIDQKTFDLAIHAIHREPQLFVLRAVSSTNTLVGEPVFAHLELISNEVVLFKAGDVLAEVNVDLEATPEVDKEILALVNHANMVAIGKGMITKNGGAVELAGEKFLNILSETKELSGAILIQAKAAEDIYPAIHPLQIELEIIQL